MDSVIHGWIISRIRISILDSDNFREQNIGAFMLRLVDTDPLVSSASVVAQPGLNGTIGMCVDGTVEAGRGDMQEFIIEVLSK